MNNSRGEFNGDLSLPDLPELIIDNIFKYLDWKSLLNCRLVWKGWEKRVKSLIEKNDNLFLNFTEHQEKIKFCFRDEDDDVIENILYNPNVLLPPGLILSALSIDTISQLERVSSFLKFRNFHWNWTFWASYRDKREITSDEFFSILRILGPTLETFDCFSMFMEGMTIDDYNKVLGTLSLPNLRKLNLPRPKMGDDNDSAHCWQRLVISAAPNLNCVQEKFRSWRTYLDIIKILNETGRLSKIKVLALISLTEGGLDILLQSGIQLEEFKARFTEQESFTKKLQTFLSKQSGTLKKLSLSSERSEPTARHYMPIVFPIMRNLTHFALGSGTLFRPLKFAQELPKLKELEVLQSQTAEYWIETLDSTFNSDNPCKTLTTLKLDMETRPIVFENWCDLFGKLFPCVSSLHLRWPTEGFLKGVWTNWPNLKELYLEDVSQGDDTRTKPCLLDNVLFGIPEEWENSVDTSQEDWWTRVTPPESEMPTMLNLKCLEKLTIPESDSKMTKFSVYFGFARMKNLRRLEKRRSEFFTVSNGDWNFLRETIPGLIVEDADDLPI